MTERIKSLKKHAKWLIPITALAVVALIVLLLLLLGRCGNDGGEPSTSGAGTTASAPLTSASADGSGDRPATDAPTTDEVPNTDAPDTSDAPDSTDRPPETGDLPQTDDDEFADDDEETGEPDDGEEGDEPVDDGEDEEPLTPKQLYSEILTAEDVTLTVRFRQESSSESIVVRKSGDLVRLNINLLELKSEGYIDLKNSLEYSKKANGSWQKKAMSDPYTWSSALESAFAGVPDIVAKNSSYKKYNATTNRYVMTTSAREKLSEAYEMEYTSVYIKYENGAYLLYAKELDPLDEDFEMIIECTISFDDVSVTLPKV